jgi:DNA invertase Pin-like site-specific DNA recombinase
VPYNVLSTELKNQIWLMYLRKSRQDNPDETVSEVLAKHEAILQEWAKRELGHEIPEDCIYREIVSGESLSERVEAQKVLDRIEDPRVVGILVVEPQRLSRGDLEDCGHLISTLRYTKTLVATPMMTYDMENKMERRFFQDELMRGRDFLEYTKEILLRGRIAAVKRGCYIGRTEPYGYNKVVIGKDHTLEPNDDADIVRLVFDLYVNQGKTYYQIACHLNDMKIPSPKGGIWCKDTIRKILLNTHYIGKVSFNKIKRTTIVENGERVTKKLTQPQEEVIMAEGKHQAIIDTETFEKAQERLRLNPSTRHNFVLQNPFAGIMYCAGCGKAIMRHPYKHAGLRLECRSRPKCYKSAKYEEVLEAVIVSLEQSELPALKARMRNGDGNSVAIQKKLLERLEKQMEEFRQQEEKQFDLLETGVYTQDRFEQRNAALRQKMEECQEKIYEAKATMPKQVDYTERVASLEKAIVALKDPKVSPEVKNKLLKAVVTKIEFSTGETGHNYTEIKLKFNMRL